MYITQLLMFIDGWPFDTTVNSEPTRIRARVFKLVMDNI